VTVLIRGFVDRETQIDLACFALSGNFECLFVVERQAELAREHVCGAAWNNSEARLSARHALNRFVNCAVAAGYNKIKLKIQPGQDVEYVRAVRAALGDHVEIMADANAAYSSDDIEHLVQLDAFGLLMLEQPFGADDLLALAELQRRMSTAICLDESITDVRRARDMIALGSGKIINIKPGRVGGFTASKAIHDLCTEAAIPVWCGGMLESGIGRAHNVALASLPNFSLPGDLSPSARYWAADIVSPEWTMDAGGMVGVPRDRRGIGVEVDAQRIDALTVRSEVLRAESVTVAFA